MRYNDQVLDPNTLSSDKKGYGSIEVRQSSKTGNLAFYIKNRDTDSLWLYFNNLLVPGPYRVQVYCDGSYLAAS